MKLLLIICALALAGCTSPTVIVTEQRPPVAVAAVKVYSVRPAGAVDVAIVNRRVRHYTRQGNVSRAIEEMKEEAAKAGANGLLLLEPFIRPTGEHRAIVEARAIHVP